VLTKLRHLPVFIDDTDGVKWAKSCHNTFSSGA